MTQLNCPVCGKTVDPQEAPSETYRDELYYFCSDTCHEQFAMDPGAHAGVN